jgi:hypothetical protein
MRAHTLAVVNQRLRHAPKSVLTEVLTGVMRERTIDGTTWVVTFSPNSSGDLVAEVRTKDTGAHGGAWAVKLRAL